MMTDYYEAFISAETEKEAKTILKTLVEKKLVAGGKIIHGPSIFWWKGKITEMPYFYANPFTISDNRDAIIQEVEQLSSEEIPIVYFTKIDSANKKFLNWIQENTRIT